jgi:hypothetical protein
MSLQGNDRKSLLPTVTVAENEFFNRSQRAVITRKEVDLHRSPDAVSPGDLADGQQV